MVPSKLEQNMVHIVVRDNGVGIAAEDLENIFTAIQAFRR